MTRVDKFGCFVKLIGVENDLKGLVHVSEMREGFTPSPHEVVREKDRIWVKVIGIMENRIRLSMKNINQNTGRSKDYVEHREKAKEVPQSEISNKEFGELTGIKIEHKNEVSVEGNNASYGEMWELSRMSYMGGGAKSRPIIKEEIEEVNIEMNDR